MVLNTNDIKTGIYYKQVWTPGGQMIVNGVKHSGQWETYERQYLFITIYSYVILKNDIDANDVKSKFETSNDYLVPIW